MNFRPAICPNCAGNLQLPDDRTSVNCMYCGTSIVVSTAVNAAAAGNVKNWLKLADTAVSAGNFEEALEYYNRVLEVDAEHSHSWYGKGLAVGFLSTPYKFRINEMLTCFRAALKHAQEGEPHKEMRESVARGIETLCDRAYRASHEHADECADDADEWCTHLAQSRTVIEGLELAHHLAPESLNIMAMIVKMCRHLQEGVSYETTGQYNQRVTMWRKPAGAYLVWLQQLEAFFSARLRALSPSPPPPPPRPVFRPRVETGIRTADILLGIGVFFMPYVFSWFTLRKGYGVWARFAAFVWLGVILVFWAVMGIAPPPDANGRLGLAPTPPAAATPRPEMSPAEKLARAKQLSGGEATAEQLSEALALLHAIPDSAPEAKEAKALQKLLREVQERRKTSPRR